jgi:hypothetical protein
MAKTVSMKVFSIRDMDITTEMIDRVISEGLCPPLNSSTILAIHCSNRETLLPYTQHRKVNRLGYPPTYFENSVGSQGSSRRMDTSRSPQTVTMLKTVMRNLEDKSSYLIILERW